MKISANNLSCIARKIKNIPQKLKREFYRIPSLQALQEQAYQKALKNHASCLPKLDAYNQKILEILQQEGTCIIPIEELELSSTEFMINTAYTLAEKLKNITVQLDKDNSCEIGSDKEDLREFSEMLFWALEPKLLDLIENYIGLPILYQGFAMRKSLADGQCSGVRRWHIDWEDRRVIKIIIYLNDVLAEGGPYNYISRQLTPAAIKKLNYYNLGYISDEQMTKAVPQSEWKICLAPKGTLVISDTGSVFHRAQAPTKYERFSITFCYTSAMPKVIWNPRKISAAQWQDIDSHTDLRQKNCLQKKRLTQFI